MWSVKWPVVAALVSLLLTGKHASGELVNVAVNKSATQSSTFSGTDGNLMYTASAGLAVDGASSKNYWTGTCALTNWRNRSACINNHWWRVDLEYNYSVHRVDVYRRNNGIQDPLTVRVGDHEEQPQARPAQDDNVLVQVNLSTPVAASTVSISLACSDILQLCEVEVFADVNIGDCSSSSCQNGGTCRGGNNFYTCDCVPGYTGTSCQTNRDECSSSPCQNGGTCRDGVNSYTCVCVPGYTGTNCEDIDECSSSPCQNGGTCRDGVNSYTCVCVPGYTGANCQTDIDECSSNPCRNNGTCNDMVNGFHCVCLPENNGTICEKGPCISGWFGSSCQFQCRCGGGGPCDVNTGDCGQGDCPPGFMGPACRQVNAAYNVTGSPAFDGETSTCQAEASFRVASPAGSPVPMTWVRIISNTSAWQVQREVGASMTDCPGAKEVTSGQVWDWYCPSLDPADALVVSPLNTSRASACEIQTDNPTAQNVAVGKPAVQSGTWGGPDTINGSNIHYNFSANLAVDGYSTTDFSLGSCIVTGLDQCNPSWQVDLQGVFDLYAITVYNREGSAHGDRFRGFALSLNSSQGWRQIYKDNSTGPVPSVTRVPLSTVQTASGVRVSLEGCTYLQLCEVEVYGTATCPDGMYGVECSQSCTCLNSSEVCHKITGACSQCPPGKRGLDCSLDCQPGSFGQGCRKQCSPQCLNSLCDVTNGSCNTCVPGWQGDICAEQIDECESSPCQNEGSCRDGVNSYTCDCVPGFSGTHCQTRSAPTSAAAVAGGISAAVIVIIIAVVSVVWFKRRHAKPDPRRDFPSKKSRRSNRQPHVQEHFDGEAGVEEEQEMESPDRDVYYNTAPPSTRLSPASLPALLDKARADPDFFKQEYQRLPQGLQHPVTVALNEHNKGKNRYKGICAYDHSRVVLSTLPDKPHSDYINACYVDGYKDSNVFIASQGPTDVNVADFLRMIWEKDIEKIAMVTNPYEMGKMKCVEYWSDAGSKVLGSFTVRVQRVTSKREVTVRTLTIKPSDGPEKLVTHFLFTAWPDKDVPDSPWPLIDFRDKVITSPSKGKAPILVHCSAGIGRTGTLIAMDILLRQLEAEGKVDVYNTVWTLRQRRVDMVQTLSQYTFLHSAALVGLCSAGRVVSLEALTSDPVAKSKSKIEKEYKALQLCVPSFSEADCSLARTPEYSSANRNPQILPPDKHVVWLREPLGEEMNYFHAVFLPNYEVEKRYILTQTPLPSTVINFWRAVLEHNVSAIVTLDTIKPDTEAAVGQYVPLDQTPVQQGPLTLTLVKTERRQGYTLRTIHVKLGQGAAPSSVLQFEINAWPQKAALPPDPARFVALVHEVLCTTLSEEGKLLVHCREGGRRSGVYVTLSTLLERSSSEGEVAVPYVVGVLASVRPQALPSKEQYAFLYAAMVSHANNNALYQNLSCTRASPRDDGSQDPVYSNE